MEVQKIDRIPWSTGAFMIAFAVIMDSVQAGLLAVPLVGWLLAPIAGGLTFLTFYLWYNFRGVRIGDSVKKMIVWLTCLLLSLLPIIGQLVPEIILGVVLTILIVKSEDALENKNIHLDLTTTQKQLAKRMEQIESAQQENIEIGNEIPSQQTA